MKILLFLGSGASVPLGYMTTEGMKNYLRELGSKYVSLSIVGNALLTPFKPVDDVEHLYYSLESLTRYLSDPISSSFFEYLMTTTNIQIRNRLDNISFASFKEHVSQILVLLEQQIYENYRWKRSAEEVIVDLYQPVFSILKKNHEISICTTNYDKSIENFCRLTQTRFYDGFRDDDFGTMEFNGFNTVPKDRILYLKIHGSLDWKESGDRIIKTSEEARSTDTNISNALWIAPTLYGKDLKNRPFNEIYEKFKEQLQQADICITIGYSFRDTQVNIEFENFIKRKRKLFIIDPHPEKIIPNLGLSFDINMKDFNPDVFVDYIKHENIFFIPVNFKKENINEVISTISIMLDNDSVSEI